MSQTKAQLVGGVGISTAENLVVSGVVTATTAVIGTATTFTEDLVVNGDARVTGILTVGTSSITLDGDNNEIRVGGGVTISSSTGLSGSGENLTSLNASELTAGTVPDARFPATLPSASGANLTSLNASNLSSGTVATARLGSGTANSSSYLRGDQTWASISSGLTITDDTSTNATRYLTFTSSTSGTITGENVSSTKLTFNPSTGAIKAFSYDLYMSANTPLGEFLEGGYLICKASSVGWIVAPNTSEVSRSFNSISDSNTRAQQVSGCTGWFVPTISQLQNPGHTCRTYWDSYSLTNYWSSTACDVFCAWRKDFDGGAETLNPRPTSNCVRSFRCVTY